MEPDMFVANVLVRLTDSNGVSKLAMIPVMHVRTRFGVVRRFPPNAIPVERVEPPRLILT
ncbi:hypothetical protein QIM30_gp1 [ssRNA phage Gerhypos.1_51]|uniref:Uncharacterized protein n=2 Tax=Norzivirales TaxID=2842247 RepID=A0A8S5L1I9_9VIRU|nr:hypothetical protein QIM30_gp1 [ssRNA phage Gerhypos.1_51]QDH90199.1 MAG: hypothetical protein H1Bulk30972_000004 [Leviviridae sp.]DAD51347.1 TPA_asm: hypothetical protein [ssRNA phage Gerhypos.1_51]